MNLIEWIKKNVKEGVNVTEAENLLQAENPLNKVQTKEEALRLIEDTPFFRSAFDSEISKKVEGALKKYEETKLPDIVKSREAEIRAELNPQETPEQKRIRELEEKIKQADNERQTESLKSSLRTKAKEIGMDPIKAERYAVYGDQAEKFMAEDFKMISEQVTIQLDGEIKKRYGGEAPKGQQRQADDGKMMSRKEFESQSPQSQMTFMKEGGKLLDEE